MGIRLNINSDTNFEEAFQNLAEQLMLKHMLATKKNKYYLAEIEFYLFHEDHHHDKTTHCHKRQQEPDKWYLHRYKDSDTIKRGKRKGLDITFGKEDYYGGILIRSLQNIDKPNDYIYGPSKLVDRILGDSGCELKDIERDSIYSNSFLKLIESDITLNESVYSIPRFGLEQSPHQKFADKNYRFFIFAKQKHPGKEEAFKRLLRENKISKKKVKVDLGYVPKINK